MFFRKECKECVGHKAEVEQLREELDAARREISGLKSAIEYAPDVTTQKVPSSDAEKAPNQNKLSQGNYYDKTVAWEDVSLQDIEREINGIYERHGRHPGSTSAVNELRAIRHGIIEKFKANKIAQENAKKFTMSDKDRARLQQKRAELKARLDPNAREEREKQIDAIKQASEEHSPTLLRNFRRSQIYDDYRGLIFDGKMIECQKFLKSLGLKTNRLTDTEAVEIIISTVTGLQEQQLLGGFSAEDYPEDGWDFEHWVADALNRYDWQARATQGSGDQGVDVVATKNGVSLGIQCKRYSGSVGNKAIQEAYSGMKHFGLDKAAVLTNANFTKSAKELAASTGVLLLSPEDIPTLSERPELGI